MKHEQNHKNNNAFTLGIFFILLIFSITFMRSIYSSKEQSGKESPQNTLNSEVNDVLRDAAKISASELDKRIKNRERLNLIDLREESEYAKEHLLDSTNIPLAKIKGNIEVLEKNQEYILIDSENSLVTTAYAIKTFSDLNFKNISYLEGGFAAWKNNFYRTISSGNLSSFSDQSKVNYIDSPKLKNMLEKENNLLIIDVRKKNEFDEGHIKNAVNIFLDDLESKRMTISASKKIVLYDNDNVGAFQAAVRLFDMGFVNVYTLGDGFDAWKTHKFEVFR